MLRNREIVLTPMTNAVGYYYNEREERINKDIKEYKDNTNRKESRYETSFDINRDFPYNIESSEGCLNTIAGRVVHELYTTNLFVSSLTFHGGTNVVGYPWGSYNHVDPDGFGYISRESPDLNAFEQVG